MEVQDALKAASVVFLVLCAIFALVDPFAYLSPIFEAKGRTFFLGGASQGLGLSLGKLLVRRGAKHVAIVSRSPKNVEAALVELEKCRVDSGQRITGHTYDLTKPDGASKAFDEAFPDDCPDVVVSVTGSADGVLGYFHKLDLKTFQDAWDMNYIAHLYTSHEASRKMIQHKRKGGKIVFVASLLAYFGLVGYSAYAPAKFAVRGLAETLKSELQMFGIDVHCHFPATIYTLGYEREARSKPQLTKILETGDSGETPDVLAVRLLHGIERGNFHITTDVLGHIFRSSHRGVIPLQSPLDYLYCFIGDLGLPIWRWSSNRQINKYVSTNPQDVF